MSLATWKKEFYPIPAQKATKAEAAQHSLTKWRGLLPRNLKKHQVTLYGAVSYLNNKPRYDEVRDMVGNKLDIDCDSCALCRHYVSSRRESYECDNCPLYRALGNKRCDQTTGFRGRRSPYSHLLVDGNPRPMIAGLVKAVKLVEKES